MRDTIARPVICVMLLLSQVGCRSVYRFRCTSNPTEAGVVVQEEMQGETPCAVEIPKDSDLIQDGQITFRFCLQDGREKTKTVCLDGLKPTNPLAEIISAPFVLVGVVLMIPFFDNDDEDEDSSSTGDEDDDNAETGLVGLGIAGAGLGIFHLLGGDMDAANGYEVHMDFDEPNDPNARIPVLPAATDGGAAVLQEASRCCLERRNT